MATRHDSVLPILGVALVLATACQLPTQQQLADWGLLGTYPPAPAVGGAPAQTQPEFGGSAGPASAPQASSVQRNPQLVGTWDRTESFGGGSSEYGGAVRETLVISGDGTFVLGPGEFAGGGPGVSGSSSGGGAQATGQWATSDEVVYVSDGSSGWEPYARFYVEPGKLMFTFADGSRQLWYRR